MFSQWIDGVDNVIPDLSFRNPVRADASITLHIRQALIPGHFSRGVAKAMIQTSDYYHVPVSAPRDDPRAHNSNATIATQGMVPAVVPTSQRSGCGRSSTTTLPHLSIRVSARTSRRENRHEDRHQQHSCTSTTCFIHGAP